MALPKTKKKIVTDISSAVQRAAENSDLPTKPTGQQGTVSRNKGGRPSPRQGNVVRQTLLLSEESAERLTMAYAAEQNKRRKIGRKLDKSQFIEEMIMSWLDAQGL
jgi:hypothetical protein